jgi:molybdopterin synthase sulfur carrier subunit
MESTGEQRRFVNLYLNDEDVRYLKGLETPVGESDVISILPAVAGGR